VVQALPLAALEFGIWYFKTNVGTIETVAERLSFATIF
jgi:hypothetical protein